MLSGQEHGRRGDGGSLRGVPWRDGVYGDRYFAFRSPAKPKGFPYLTGRDKEQMLRYRPRFRYP